MKKYLLNFLLAFFSVAVLADTPPQVINKLCSANQFFSQIQPGAGNINCTQPTYSGISNTPTFANSLQYISNLVSLVGDSSGPGASKYYGTNASSTKGFYSVPVIGLGITNGLSITSQLLSLGLSSSTTTGALSSTDWNTFNNKSPSFSVGNLTDVGTDGILVTGGTGAVVGSGTSIAQHVSDTTHSGYLSSTDWNTFNGKQAAGNYITALTSDVVATGPGSVSATIQPNVVTNSKLAQMAANTVKANTTGALANASDAALGTLTESTSSVLTLVGWADATIGSPTIQVLQSGASQSGYLSSTDWSTFNSKQDALSFTAPLVNTTNTVTCNAASASQPGCLSSTDWSTFNGKQGAGNYITALTGDGTASGPGSSALTLATVNSNVGSFGSASSVPAFTVNAKGLVTAASSTSIQIAESQVTNLVTDLAGKQPTGNYITALTSDVSASGPGSATATVNSVGGSSASAVNTATIAANNATTLNTASTIVKRDGSGNFVAGTITAALSGNASTATALAANPTDCGAGTKAIAIDASGNLTCSAVSLTADVSGNLPVTNLNSGTSASSSTFWRGDGTWAAPVGTVSSVALSLPSFITVTGSPVTSSGTLTGTLVTQSANTVFSGPTTGVAATPTFRSLVAADIPSLPYSSSTLTSAHLFVGNVSNVATDTAITGDVTIDNTGVTAIGATKVTNAMLAGSIADTKLSTISTAGKVSNSATTATSSNTNSAIVARDGSGNFSAGTITAALTGNASTATALASNPTDCGAGTKAIAIDASGNLTCSAVDLTADVSGALPILNGGTGQTAKTAAFNALSPLSSRGDLITRDATNNIRLGIGAANTVLKTDGTDPSWALLVNANIDSAAAIAYSKLNLSASIATGDLASGLLVPSTKGGTGVNNAGTLTYGSNNITVTTSGTTSVTIPTSGTLAPGLNWTSYTPTVVGLGTISNVSVFFRREGDSVRVRGSFTCGTTTGVATTISLPSGANTIDTTKTPVDQTAFLGTYYRAAGGGGVPSVSVGAFPITAVVGTSTSVVFLSQSTNSATPGFQTVIGSNVANSTDRIMFDFDVPVTQYAF